MDTLPARSKICALLMDEVSLKSNIFYDPSKDSIIGLEDYGKGSSLGLVATSALVFMVRGVFQSYIIWFMSSVG